MQAVKDYMTRKVVFVTADTPVREIIHLFLKHNISSVPVLDINQEIAGIVTEGDLLHRVHLPSIIAVLKKQGSYYDPDPLIYKYRRMGGKTAAAVMTEHPVVIEQDVPVESAINLMIERKLKSIPVVRGKKLAGIISRIDVMRYLMDTERDMEKYEPTDDEISELAAWILNKGIKFEIGGLNVKTANGRVSVTGTAEYPVDAKEITDLVGSIRGVKSVDVSLLTSSLLH